MNYDMFLEEFIDSDNEDLLIEASVETDIEEACKKESCKREGCSKSKVSEEDDLDDDYDDEIDDFD